MTQEEKQLLLKDLSARLPYGVKISRVVEDYISEPRIPRTINIDGCIVIENEPFNDGIPDVDYWYICEVKPYLRPMSSMTKEEEKEYNQLCYNCQEQDSVDYNITELDRIQLIYVVDWLNAHHFDYRGLIEKGLALEAPEGMYKIN